MAVAELEATLAALAVQTREANMEMAVAAVASAAAKIEAAAGTNAMAVSKELTAALETMQSAKVVNVLEHMHEHE